MNHKLGKRRIKAEAEKATRKDDTTETKDQTTEKQGGAARQPMAKYNTDFWNAVGTVVIAVFTIVLAVVGIFQYSALLTTDDTQRANERAYLMPKGFRIVGYGERDPGSKELLWKIVPSWENSGDTPATNLVMTITFSVLKSKGTDYPPWAHVIANGASPIETDFFPPKQTQQETPQSFTGSDMHAIVQGHTRVTAVGVAFYKDIFGAPHVTISCHWISNVPDLDYLDPETLKGQPYEDVGHECPDHNCTDEQCREYKGESWVPQGVEFP